MLPPDSSHFRPHLTHNRSQSLPPKTFLTFRDGQFAIAGLGQWYTYWRDPYHLMLTIPWPGFLALIGLIYLTVNTLFAIAYLAGGDCIQNMRPGSFSDAFFFSVQTLATIGYGSMFPTTAYANGVVVVEAMASILGIAVITGLAFARFAQPTARVIFSRVAVVTPYNGIPTLMFRAANQRRNLILEAKLRLFLMQDEISTEGEFIRRFYELKLLRNYTPSFNLSWMVMHPIDRDSPLFNATPDTLAQRKAAFVVSLSGIDETVAQALHARYYYGIERILWDYRFVDIFHTTASGDRFIDYTHFHEVEP